MFVIDLSSEFVELELGQVGDEGSVESSLNAKDLGKNLIEVSLVYNIPVNGDIHFSGHMK